MEPKNASRNYPQKLCFFSRSRSQLGLLDQLHWWGWTWPIGIGHTNKVDFVVFFLETTEKPLGSLGMIIWGFWEFIGGWGLSCEIFRDSSQHLGLWMEGFERYIIYTSLAMIPGGFTCSASIAHSLVSISLKSMEHSSFLRAPSDFVPHKKLHASKFGHIAILWKKHVARYHLDLLFEVQPLPEALGPGPWKCHAVVRHLLSNLELARANEQMYCIFLFRLTFPRPLKWERVVLHIS